MNYHDVLPMLSVAFGIVALVLGFFSLVLEHAKSPLLNRVFIGLTMFGVLATIDEACRCAIAQERFDWRLTLFVIGIAGAWYFRVAKHFKRPKEKVAS